MAGRRRVFGDGISAGSSKNDAPLHNQKLSSFSSEPPLDSPFISGPSSSFLGSRSMVSFENVNGGNRSGTLFFHSFNQDENGDEDLEEYFRQPDKKRRLTVDQVHFLERNFEMENKLEPERKVQLAKDLGLQPRQVAIWFQNRRARWKTKQLEKDYEALQCSYDSLKDDYDSLLEEKEKLKAEVLHLRDKVLLKEKGSENSDLSDTDKLSEAPPQEPTAGSVNEDEVSKVITVPCKQEDLMAKSDVFDSESPSYIDVVHSSLLEPGDSSHVFEPDQSDLSQDEDDNLSKSLLPIPTYGFSKIEDASSPVYSFCYRFQDEDQTFGFWSC